MTPQELREKVARAIVTPKCGHLPSDMPDKLWKNYLDDADAAIRVCMEEAMDALHRTSLSSAHIAEGKSAIRAMATNPGGEG